MQMETTGIYQIIQITSPEFMMQNVAGAHSAGKTIYRYFWV